MRWGQGRVAFRKGLPRPSSTPLWEAAEARLKGCLPALGGGPRAMPLGGAPGGV